MTPIEQAERKIESQKKRLMERIVPEKSEVFSIETRLTMLTEDLDSKYRKIDELNKEKEQLEKQMKEFSGIYKKEFQLVLEDIDAEDKLIKQNVIKSNMESQMLKNEEQRLELMKKINENKELIARLEVQDKDNEKSIETALTKNMNDINELEKLIELKCGLKNNEFSDLILDEAKKMNINIDKSIFNIQSDLVAAEISQMIKDQSVLCEKLASKIEFLKSGDVAPEEIKAMEDKYTLAKLSLDEKINEADQWKVNMSSMLKINKDDSLPKELLIEVPELIESIIQTLQTKAGSEEVALVIKDYQRKLIDREQFIQKLVAKSQNLKSHIEELSSENDKYTINLKVMEKKGQEYKNKFREMCVNVKSLENKIKQRRGKIEAALKAKHDEYNKFIRTENTFKKGGKQKKEAAKNNDELELIKQEDQKKRIRTISERLRLVNNILGMSQNLEDLNIQINSVIF